MNLDIVDVKAVYRQAPCFEGVEPDFCDRLAQVTDLRQFEKGETVFPENKACQYFRLVVQGLVRVSILSASGLRMTYLLAGPGEPLNLVGPFTGAVRPFHAEAVAASWVARIKRHDFIFLADRHPTVLRNIIGILGSAVDSANSRVLDMMDKRVFQRLARVLLTLHRKFGPNLEFTSNDLAELAGTTPESTLRAMSVLRDEGIVRTARGQIMILKPEKLEEDEAEVLWL